MKTLNKEAKIHLATKVDDWKYRLFNYKCNPKEVFFKENKEVLIQDYNPNDPDSPYCMKYLRGLLNGLPTAHRIGIQPYVNYNNLKMTIDMILEYTGFKGEVWE